MAVIVNPNQDQETRQETGPDGQPLQTIGTAAPSGQGPAGTPMARSQANSLAQQQRTGSGRFTNLQKYLQANKDSGQRIAQTIGQNINQNLQKQQDKAQDYYSKLGQTTEQARQVAEQGKGFQQQLQGIGGQIQQATLTPEQLVDKQLAQQRLNERQQLDMSTIEQFTQSPDFQTFQDIQAGRGIDESLLSLQQQRAYQQALEAQQSAQQSQQQLGSETGRFDLLRQTFGNSARPGYTQGQQRLDQVLLGQGGGLRDVQGAVSTQAKMAQEQARLAGAQAGEVSRLAAQEQGVIGDIQSQASKNEQAYLDMLQSYMNPLNQARQTEFEDLSRALNTYVPNYIEPNKKEKIKGGYVQKEWQPGFTEEQMNRLGLTDPNQGIYNVFRAKEFIDASKQYNDENTANKSALANIIARKGEEATSAEHVAEAQDLARYKALRSMMGGVGEDRLTKTRAETIGDAWASRANTEKEGGLKGRLDRAQEAFDKLDQFTYKGGSGTFGSQSIKELIEGGRVKPTDVFDERGFSIQPGARYADGTAGFYRDQQNLLYKALPKALEKFFQDQNYNRTLGGRRETWLDTKRSADILEKGLTPKIDPTPITQYDPSLGKTPVDNTVRGDLPVDETPAFQPIEQSLPFQINEEIKARRAAINSLINPVAPQPTETNIFDYINPEQAIKDRLNPLKGIETGIDKTKDIIDKGKKIGDKAKDVVKDTGKKIKRGISNPKKWF